MAPGSIPRACASARPLRLRRCADHTRGSSKAGGHIRPSKLVRGRHQHAQLASIATYYDCVPGFRRELAAVDGDLDAFYWRVRELAKLDQEKRDALVCGTR